MTKGLGIAAKYNLVLLFLVFVYVFLVGILPTGDFKMETYSLVFSAIYLVSARIISQNNNNKRYFIYAGIVILIMWLSDYLDFYYLSLISFITSILFLGLTIVLMVIRIAKSKNVGLLEFVEAINIYFVMGIIGSILFQIVHKFVPVESFNIPGETLVPITDFIYFMFVTLSTLGYGDISPIEPIAKSLAIFLAIAGQLYLTMIIALLVGKYLSAKQD